MNPPKWLLRKIGDLGLKLQTAADRENAAAVAEATAALDDAGTRAEGSHAFRVRLMARDLRAALAGNERLQERCEAAERRADAAERALRNHHAQLVGDETMDLPPLPRVSRFEVLERAA